MDIQKYYIKTYNQFPTAKDLNSCKKSSLGTHIIKFGGFRKFAKILGYESQTKAYSEEYVIRELKSITNKLGHFPCDRELQEMKRSDLASNIKNHGGYGYFKEKIIGSRNKRPFGYWNDENNILKELCILIKQLGHFPQYSELGHIAKGIDKSKKGMKYFEKKLTGAPHEIT